MRRMLAVGLIVAFLPALSLGQEQGWAAKFFTGGLRHDFGNVPWGAQLTHTFTITNIYNVPFVVEEARVSCGCVATKRPSGVIPPRGTAELEINMDTRKAGATGQPKVVNIYVKLTSAPEKTGDRLFSSNCTLQVSCLAQSNIRFSHDKMHFGVVRLGQTPRAVLDVEHFTNPGFQITGVAPHEQPVDVTVERAAPRLGGRVAYRLIGTLKGNAPAGEIKYEVKVTTNDPTTPVMDVVMEGVIQAPLVAAPNNVELGNVRVGEVVSGRVVLRGSGQPFKVLSVSGEGDGMKVKFTDKSAAAHLLIVEFVPTQPGKVSRTVTIKTDLPGDLSATFNANGVGIP